MKAEIDRTTPPPTRFKHFDWSTLAPGENVRFKVEGKRQLRRIRVSYMAYARTRGARFTSRTTPTPKGYELRVWRLEDAI